MEVVLLNPSIMELTDFAFAWRACALQWERHVLPAWDGYLLVPAAAKWTVSGFTDAANLVPGSHFPIQVVASTGDPGVLGDHSGLRRFWKAFGRATPDPVAMSHELIELMLNPFLDGWVQIPGTDDMEAEEGCDRVEGDSYPIEVSIGGVARDVFVSNFLLPFAFGMEGNGLRLDYDHMGLLQSADEIRPGGYRIVRKANGDVVNEFANEMASDARDRIAAKLGDPMSRTARRFDK
jgi:hypothetical protein